MNEDKRDRIDFDPEEPLTDEEQQLVAMGLERTTIVIAKEDGTTETVTGWGRMRKPKSGKDAS